ncbi:E3 ubiquitin-protein ligase Mdm2-like [Phlebotomus argentipes]|uniref:E3 ubiquitin-protein ligase Mdm2-like n=1 Tax=Phlebotomus argentipes TaxID=94469 RepID=UPI002892EBFE|nr:E3 ubiquitin-protein ligase Mdm2-like [Phlebotomus argentipes]
MIPSFTRAEMCVARQESLECEVKLTPRDDEGFSEGVLTPKFYVTLAEESPQESVKSDDDASYDSFNERETDLCKDTTDTESPDDNELLPVLQFEVATDSSSENKLYSDDSSTGTDIILTAMNLMHRKISLSRSESSLSKGTEASYENPKDRKTNRIFFRECVKCKSKQKNPLYRYCENCYRTRKEYFPARPKRRKKRTKSVDIPDDVRKKVRYESKPEESDGQTILPESQETTICKDPMRVKNSNPLDEPCIICLKEPKNGVFVHSSCLHLCCCYKCAKKTWNMNKKCPICNSKVRNVLRLFIH